MLVMVMISAAFCGTYRVSSRSIEVKDFVQYSFFFETGEYPVEGHAVDFTAQYFL
jgi:hypothetical protein